MKNRKRIKKPEQKGEQKQMEIRQKGRKEEEKKS